MLIVISLCVVYIRHKFTYNQYSIFIKKTRLQMD